MVGTVFPLFAAPTAGGDVETTLFRFTSSDEGGALANSAASAREPRGACNLEGCADTADADHVGLAGDAGWGAGHDDDTVTVGDASAFG